MARLSKIEGIGKVYATKLNASGIKSTDELLAKCATSAGRKDLARNTKISDALLLKWANRADLFRITGIGEEYSDLLEYGGVDTVPELAQRNAENLHQKLVEVNTRKSLVRKLPGPGMVSKWVAQAKKLKRVMTY